MGRVGKFLKDEEAGVTVEFVSIVGFFFFLCFMILQVALAIYWWQTADAAAQVGARYAVVYDPVATALAGATNTKNSSNSYIYGQSCDISQAAAADPCTAFTSVTCTSTSATGCNQTTFTAIVGQMQNVFGALQASNVTIRYSYAGLGFAGGPIAPAVTVTISGVPFAFGDFLGGLLGNSPLTTVPTMSATFTGEDLSSSGAS